jgi:hypothetical protein
VAVSVGKTQKKLLLRGWREIEWVTGIAAWDAVHKISDAEQRGRGTAIRGDVPCIQTADNAFR